MQKLSGLDAGFLYNETPLCPQQVGTVQLLELPDGVVVDTFIDSLKQLLMARIHLVPYLTNRLVNTPFLIDHPVWDTDPSFDIDNHVERCDVAAPGARKQWEAAVAELHEQPFDRSRPMWRLVVLTGLEGGRIAYYFATHHACIDGMSAQAALQLLMDKTPQPREVEPAPEDFFEPRQYSALDLMSAATENFLKAQVRQFSGVLDMFDTGLRMQRRALEPSADFGALAEAAPSTRFNKSISGKRTYATGEVSLSAAKKVVKATGCTLNDLFLALCGGGVRRYLQRSGELPKESMIAGCPVSLRRAGDKSMNNQVTLMQVTLATDQADPIRRLGAIAASSKTAKSVTTDLAGMIDANPVSFGLPAAMQAMAAFGEATRAADNAPNAFNVLVSNVPGPRNTLYSAGARMLTHYPVSIAAHGIGVNITLQSYDGSMFFAITACAEALPDSGVLRDDMLQEFAALEDALWTAELPAQNPQPAAPTRVASNEPARAA
jgi:WS/DGAT/MGAT family acyltransferase